MNILLVVNHWAPTGGIERMCTETVSAFAGAGADVTIWAVHDCEPRTINNRTAIPLAPKGKPFRFLYFNRLWARQLEMRIRREALRFDLIVVGHIYLLQPTIFGLDSAARPPVWVWAYGLEVWGEFGRSNLMMAAHAQKVLSISRFTSDQISYAVPPDRISLIPPAVDLDLFKPADNLESIDRDSLLIVGRLSKQEQYKGHDALIRLLPKMSRSLSRPIHLRIVGDGDDRPRLERLAKDVAVEEQVHFLGSVSLDDLVREYQRCAVFALPSILTRHPTGPWTGEGFGIVYLEAQACGRPIVASIHGGAPETLKNGETGHAVDPLQDDEILAAVSDILSDPVKGARMGREARAFMETAFSSQRFHSQLTALLNAI